MFKFVFKNRAAKEIDKLPSAIRGRILLKLKFYASQSNPLDFAERLTDHQFSQWRFRIGDHRVLFDAVDGTIVILKVGHRKDCYK